MTVKTETLNVIFEGGESRNNPQTACDYMLACVGDIELYAECEAAESDENRDKLLAEILCLAGDNEIIFNEIRVNGEAEELAVYAWTFLGRIEARGKSMTEIQEKFSEEEMNAYRYEMNRLEEALKEEQYADAVHKDICNKLKREMKELHHKFENCDPLFFEARFCLGGCSVWVWED